MLEASGWRISQHPSNSLIFWSSERKPLHFSSENGHYLRWKMTAINWVKNSINLHWDWFAASKQIHINNNKQKQLKLNINLLWINSQLKLIPDSEFIDLRYLMDHKCNRFAIWWSIDWFYRFTALISFNSSSFCCLLILSLIYLLSFKFNYVLSLVFFDFIIYSIFIFILINFHLFFIDFSSFYWFFYSMGSNF